MNKQDNFNFIEEKLNLIKSRFSSLSHVMLKHYQFNIWDSYALSSLPPGSPYLQASANPRTGQIQITDDLIDILIDKPAQLFLILGHELGHCFYKHGPDTVKAGPSMYISERQADSFAGVILNMFNIDPKEAYKLFPETLKVDELTNSIFYPSLSQRLQDLQTAKLIPLEALEDKHCLDLARSAIIRAQHLQIMNRKRRRCSIDHTIDAIQFMSDLQKQSPDVKIMKEMALKISILINYIE